MGWSIDRRNTAAFRKVLWLARAADAIDALGAEHVDETVFYSA